MLILAFLIIFCIIIFISAVFLSDGVKLSLVVPNHVVDAELIQGVRVASVFLPPFLLLPHLWLIDFCSLHFILF